MKKFYTLTLSIFALLTSFGNANAQFHIKYHYMIDSCYKEIVHIITSDSLGTHSLRVETTFGDGGIDTGNVGSYGLCLNRHSYTSTGTYTVKSVLLTSTGSRIDSASFTIVYGGCSYITGRLYDDKNSNCLDDTGDVPMHAASRIEVDSAGHVVDTITGYSTFTYKAKGFGKSYTFKVIHSPTGFTNTCPTSGSLTATSSSTGTVAAGDFGFSCSTTGFDVAVHGSAHVCRRYIYAYYVLTNTNCNAKSGTLTVNIDSRYTGTPHYYPSTGGSVSGHTVSWNYTGLTSDHPQYFVVYDTTGTWLSTGDTVTTTANVTPTAGDADTTNNTTTSVKIVPGSYDPNDKTVFPEGVISSGTMLTYTLAFQNAGNDTAFNIHIMDTLSSYLDASTIQLVTSTYSNVSIYQFPDPVSGRTIVKFDFPGINLLDSTHHDACSGFVNFTVNTKGGLANGTVINNQAGIWFDYNPVVMTNTVSNTIGTLSVTQVNNMSNVAVFPNPVGSDLTIQTTDKQFDKLVIINTLGQVLIQQTIQSDLTHVNVKSLLPGMYYIMLQGANGSRVEKIEKL